jgi:RNA recognition motif-containing protein
MGASSCFADFVTHKQAQRAMEAMDGLPLLGREVDIELAQEATSVYDRKEHPTPVKPMVATPRDKSFLRQSS